MIIKILGAVSMRILKNIALSFILLAVSFNVNAKDRIGAAKNIKAHQSWSSALLYYENNSLGRLLSYSDDKLNSLIIDVYSDSKYTIQIFIKKDSERIGSSHSKYGYTPCSARIDKKNIYSSNCKVADDSVFYFISPDANDLGSEFIRDCKQGNTVRFKVDMNSDSYYFSYSLKGFSFAFNRALGFTRNNDASYFE